MQWSHRPKLLKYYQSDGSFRFGSQWVQSFENNHNIFQNAVDYVSVKSIKLDILSRANCKGPTCKYAVFWLV